MNNKIKNIIILIVIVMVIGSIIGIKEYLSKRVSLEELLQDNEVTEPVTSTFALMLEQSDGTYKESSSNKWPSNMKYNSELSKCIDVNGNVIDNAISYDNNTKLATVKTTKTAYCYVYFDKDSSVYAKVIEDYENNNGVSKLSDSDKGNRDYDTYYYTGDVTNNNVLYGGFCWKMVITTEGEGVKMIYNGVPTNGSCDNTKDATTIGSSAFNSSYNSPAYVGYMYNKVYTINQKLYTVGIEIIKVQYGMSSSSNKYYFSTSYVYNNGYYELNDATTYTWENSYNNLVGYYTCKNISKTSCSTLYYVIGTNNSEMYYISLSKGNDFDAYNIKLFSSYIDNGNGTYTLNNPLEITRKDYYDNYSSYEGYYFCGGLSGTTCSEIYEAYNINSSIGNRYIYGYKVDDNYKYGNTFDYDKDTNTYTLSNTKTIKYNEWQTKYDTLNYNHYTCFNNEGVCENEIYYIFNTSSTAVYYIKLTDGKSIEDAINEMLYNDDVNEYDSTIKAYIDSWYENNLLNATDSNGNKYSSYLQNTIYCNNRAITSLGGFNANGGSNTSNYWIDFNNNSLDCANTSDQFTLSVDNGGTEGYGNNVLDYPIGLLNYKEVDLVRNESNNNYLNSKKSYWLISPSSFIEPTSNVYYLNYNGMIYNTDPSGKDGVRPALTLSNKVKITLGDGTVANPYVVGLA